MLQEFKQFVSRGNVMDLAVAVVIGTAFTAIVQSLVGDVIMPIVGVLLGGIDFTSYAIEVGDASIGYGRFVQALIDFLMVSAVVFLMVRSVNRLQQGGDEEEPDEPAGPTTQELLIEIRDLLKRA